MPERIALSGTQVFQILKNRVGYKESEYVVLVARKRTKNPFLLLVSIILSQNTSDKNSIKALQEFINIIGESCSEAIKKPISSIEKAIKPAGLYKQKARTIRELALKLCAISEDFLLQAPVEEVKEFLLSIEGIGYKTVDVFLSVARGAPVFAVDTHARRIAIRWGLVSEKASYHEVSRALLEFFGKDKAEEAHRLLIALGRKYCKSKKPRCIECPLRNYCPHARKLLQLQSQREQNGATKS